MLHISERQMRAWERLGFIPAADGYSFRDLIALRTLCELRAHRIPPRRIARALESLKRLLSEVERPLAELKIFSDGRRIAVRVAGQNMEASTGQILFDFDTAELGRVQPLTPQRAGAPRSGNRKPGSRKACFWKRPALRSSRPWKPICAPWSSIRNAAGALVNLGTIHYRLRQFKEAERYYTQSLAADPSYPLAHFNLGNLYDERGDLGKPQHCYESALRLNPRYRRRPLQSGPAVRAHGRRAAGRAPLEGVSEAGQHQHLVGHRAPPTRKAKGRLAILSDLEHKSLSRILLAFRAFFAILFHGALSSRAEVGPGIRPFARSPDGPLGVPTARAPHPPCNSSPFCSAIRAWSTS